MDDVRESLVELLGRPIVLELQIARLQGHLRRSTPEERFREFVATLADPAVARGLLAEYPVLARQIVLCIDHWVTAVGEFLERLCDDWADIRARLCPTEDPGVLVGLQIGSGDKHRQGRSVIAATFSTGFRLIYKPRSMTVDVNFQHLLSWVNARRALPPFRTVAVINRGTHGWAEFVHARGCTTTGQVSRFYLRQGGYLAILHALRAVDFHHENLVAAGEHPVLVDLEALFHPELYDPGRTAEAALADSVLRIGLLPERVLPEGAPEGIDISGLGATEGALWPWETPHWHSAGTDEMRMTRARTMMVSEARHRPTLNGVPTAVADHADEVAAGFRSVYDVLCRDRADLLAPGGPVARFAHDEVRVIVRPTNSYAILLHASLHPDVLRDAADRDRLLDKLSGMVQAVPVLGRVVAAEHADLRAGDIPLFTGRPSSRHLWTSRGELLPEVLNESGLDRVRWRLEGMGPVDLIRQEWFINASFASLRPADDRMGVAPTSPGSRRLPAAPTSDRLLASACAVGDRLAELAWRTDEACSWVGLSLSQEERWAVGPLGPNLYDGLPGVALFLAQLGAATGRDDFTDLAEGALATMRSTREIDKELITGIGAYAGWGGTIYTLVHLASLWKSDVVLHEAQAVAEQVEPLIERDEALDLFSGAAGCALALLTLHRYAPSVRTLAAAMGCGLRILSRATRVGDGLGWCPAGSEHPPLAGLSHGAAGIAMVLQELWADTGYEPFRAAALDGLTYERNIFCPGAGNWPDLRPLTSSARRPDDGLPRFRTAVCHGAPGIGLARLRMFGHNHDDELRREIVVALETTARHGWGLSHSLCHGDLGNLELLLEASRTLDDERWAAQVARTSAVILDDIDRTGWRCANPGSTQSPELMTGLAGIGYGLLRLAAPADVPSVLGLAAPARAIVSASPSS